MPRGYGKKHKDDGFLLYNHSHNKYKGLNKDCQLGNPCEMKSDPRVDNEDPIIEKILFKACFELPLCSNSLNKSEYCRLSLIDTCILALPSVNCISSGLLRQCPHHGFSELHQLDAFYNSLNTNDQDALGSAAGGNFLDKMPRDGLAIIESKSKVRYSRSRTIEPRASTNAPLSTSTPSNSFEFQQLAASLEDKMDIRMSRLAKMISEKKVTTPATVKAIEEVCVTCGSNHNFNNCLLIRNEFPAFHDNIH
ncbi:hypothetical protein Tco_0449664 [Tanacetum coccineum]